MINRIARKAVLPYLAGVYRFRGTDAELETSAEYWACLEMHVSGYTLEDHQHGCVAHIMDYHSQRIAIEEYERRSEEEALFWEEAAMYSEET